MHCAWAAWTCHVFIPLTGLCYEYFKVDYFIISSSPVVTDWHKQTKIVRNAGAADSRAIITSPLFTNENKHARIFARGHTCKRSLWKQGLGGIISSGFLSCLFSPSSVFNQMLLKKMRQAEAERMGKNTKRKARRVCSHNASFPIESSESTGNKYDWRCSKTKRNTEALVWVAGHWLVETHTWRHRSALSGGGSCSILRKPLFPSDP